MKPLPRSFYLRPALRVARELLGKYLVRRVARMRLVGKIVEVEAYREGDPASHSFRGKTRRNEVMFWQGGYLYVYFTYGMHFCANVVTGPEGKGEAVLIRAVEPVEGIKEMKRRRKRKQGGRTGRRKSPSSSLQSSTPLVFQLTNGPAKLCQAFGIDRRHNGTDLTRKQIFIAEGETLPSNEIGRSARIGIRNGREKRWRFFVRGNTSVSKQ